MCIRDSATPDGAFFDTWTYTYGSNGYAYVEISQLVDVTGTNTIYVPYDVTDKQGVGTSYLNARVGSGTTYTRSEMGSGTFSVDVSGVDGNQILKIWVVSEGASYTGMEVYVTGVTGTHNRSAPVIDDINTDKTEGIAPLTVNFTADVTAGVPDVRNYDWNFYKGTSLLGSSTAESPSYTFNSGPGTYYAILYVDNNYYFSNKGQSDDITILEGISAAFSANVTEGNAPLAVKFTDSSSGSPDTWFWNFGDGTNSTSQHPEKTYSAAGVYTVSLNASNAHNSDIETKNNYITVNDVPPYTGNAVGGTVRSEAFEILVGATVTLSNATTTLSTETTNATGWYMFDGLADGTTYVLVAKKSSYLDAYTDPFTLSGGEYKTVNFFLVPFGSTATGGIGVQYPPHLVRLILVDWMGNPVSGATVTAQGYETTAGAWDWLTALFGFDADKTPLANATMTGTTGSDGAIAFTMLENVKYNIRFVKASDSIDFSVTLYPSGSEYLYRVPRSPVVETRKASLAATGADHNATYSNITGRIDIETPATNAMYTIRIYDADKVQVASQSTILNTATPNATLVYQVPTEPGAAYYVRGYLDGNPAAFDQTIVITLRGRIIDLGIDTEFYPWIATILIICIAVLFTGTYIKMGAVIVPCMGAFFWWIGWMPAISILAISTAMIFGVLYYMRKGEAGG